MQCCRPNHGKTECWNDCQYWFNHGRNVSLPKPYSKYYSLKSGCFYTTCTRSSPWSGIYCASKAAANSISEVLSMELRPFGISVLHVAPGGVKSNIAVNGVNRLTLPENTLYARFIHNIFERINMSQDSTSMESDEFAKRVVRNALKKNPPRYMVLGGRSTLLSFLKWLPKRLVLYFMWRRFSSPT